MLVLNEIALFGLRGAWLLWKTNLHLTAHAEERDSRYV